MKWEMGNEKWDGGTGMPTAFTPYLTPQASVIPTLL